MSETRKINREDMDCFFLDSHIDVDTVIYDCKLLKTCIDGCVKNCPFQMSNEQALQALEAILKRKNG